MTKSQNSLSLRKLLNCVAVASFGSSEDTADKSNDSINLLKYATAWRAIQQALIFVTLIFLPLLSPTPVLAQDKNTPSDLLDKSLEDLMAIRVDSVYTASGFKQKVTEAPASVTIVTSEEIKKVV